MPRRLGIEEESNTPLASNHSPSPQQPRVPCTLNAPPCSVFHRKHWACPPSYSLTTSPLNTSLPELQHPKAQAASTWAPLLPLPTTPTLPGRYITRTSVVSFLVRPQKCCTCAITSPDTDEQRHLFDPRNALPVIASSPPPPFPNCRARTTP